MTIKILISLAVFFVFFGAYNMAWKVHRFGFTYRKPNLAWFCFFIAMCCGLGVFVFGE